MDHDIFMDDELAMVSDDELIIEDELLMKIIANKNPENKENRDKAFSKMHKKYGRFIRNKVALYCNFQDVHIDGLTQEVWIKIINASGTFSAKKGCFKGWTNKIIENKCKDVFLRKKESFWYKKGKIKPPDDGENNIEVENDSTLSSYQAVESKDCFENAIECFSEEYPEHSRCLSIWSSGTLKIKQLAKLCGKNEGAMRQYIYHARKYFKPYIDPCR